MLRARHSSTQVRSVITITGLGDHDQPDWLITMTGIRKKSSPRRLPAALVARNRRGSALLMARPSRWSASLPEPECAVTVRACAARGRAVARGQPWRWFGGVTSRYFRPPRKQPSLHLHRGGEASSGMDAARAHRVLLVLPGEPRISGQAAHRRLPMDQPWTSCERDGPWNSCGGPSWPWPRLAIPRPPPVRASLAVCPAQPERNQLPTRCAASPLGNKRRSENCRFSRRF
jgi:hypothetical protein